MKKDLRDLLVEFLKHENLVGSWGVTKIQIGETDVSFNVSAFKYAGQVQIKCQKGVYDVILGTTTITGLTLKIVVETIDVEIETSDDYYIKIANWVETITNRNTEE